MFPLPHKHNPRLPDHASRVSRWTFRPKRVFFERAALDHDLGRRLWERLGRGGEEGPAEVRVIPSHNRVSGLSVATAAEAYREAKRTLVVGVRKGLDFAPCRPSADYQLPLVTSCPGLCEYCYLQTTLGPRPYVRVYVNLDEILGAAAGLARARLAEGSPDQRARATPATGGAAAPLGSASAGAGSGARRPVYFEGAAVGDPVPVEPLTGALATAVRFFAGLPGARFRFVTKFPDVDGLLGLDHRGHTRARVTVNTPRVIREFDRGTPGLETRLETLARLAGAGYPVGPMVAPVFLEGEWRREYEELFARLSEVLAASSGPDATDAGADGYARPTLEVVTHRFTARARKVILDRFPGSRLPLGGEGRRLKRGQFGYFKYVYPDELLQEAGGYFRALAERYLPGVTFEYLV